MDDSKASVATSADPNKVFTVLVEVFVVVGYERAEAKNLASTFWKKIYIDSVMMMADHKEGVDKNRLREVAEKGIMTELLIEALKYVPADEMEAYVAKVAKNYSSILWQEMEWNLDEEKKAKIKELWGQFGVEKEIVSKEEVSDGPAVS